MRHASTPEAGPSRLEKDQQPRKVSEGSTSAPFPGSVLSRPVKFVNPYDPDSPFSQPKWDPSSLVNLWDNGYDIRHVPAFRFPDFCCELFRK
jgi:hypothetical protein